MVIAVTGGTGFIGKHLIARLLSTGEELRVLSRCGYMESVHGVTYYQGDLMQKESLIDFLDGVDILYHCAGQLTDEALMRSLHVDGTQNLIDAATGKIGHWVQLSSVGVYGPISKGTVTESFSINPVGEYEVTKTESDELILSAAGKGLFTYSILRPSNIFGADMTNQSLFSMIKMIERGLFFFIGPKGASANYVHVDDVVEALILCGQHKKAIGKIFNISDYCVMEEFVEMIVAELSVNKHIYRLPKWSFQMLIILFSKLSKFPLTHARVHALTNRSVYSVKLIQQELGYHYRTGIKNGLKDLVHGYKTHNE